MVTAELALTFPAVILVLVSLALTGAAGMAQVQVNSSSRAACRAIAIGEDTLKAVSLGEHLLGRGGTVEVSPAGKEVHCVATKNLPAMLGLLGMQAKSEAVIPSEDAW